MDFVVMVIKAYTSEPLFPRKISPASPRRDDEGDLPATGVRWFEYMRSSPDPLPPLLASWRVEPSPDPGFRRAVRDRLGPGSAAASWAAFVRRRATLVAGGLAVALIGGALSGHGRARARIDEDRARLASAYVAGLDARRMVPPR